MAQINKPQVFRVVLTEYERGWGSKHWDTLYFDNEAEAREYALNYNRTNNTATTAPDWYVQAEYVGQA